MFGIARSGLMGRSGRGFLAYIASTGGTITYDGDYKIHTFTSSGTFSVTQQGDSGTSRDSYDILVVGGGSNGHSGGGNGGDVSYTTGITSPSVASHTITVGGAGSTSSALGQSASGDSNTCGGYNGNYSYDHGCAGLGSGNYSISGSSLCYGGYGGGAYYGGGYVASRQTASCRGGNGGNGNDPQNATANSGSGGGGTWTKSAGQGGTGIVTIRYKYQN
jgi:hypothetical protein